MAHRSGHRRQRRHQLLKQQQYQQKQLASRLDKLGGAALSQPMFLLTSSKHEVTISRDMPGVLLGHMDDKSWNSFCDTLDTALLPMANMKKTMKTWCMYPLAFFIPLVLIGLITTAIAANQLNRKMLPIVFLVAFVVAILWALGMADYSSRCRTKMNEGIEKVCYETSISHPGISFKVFIELQYIQVIVTSVTLDSIETEIHSNSTSSTDFSGDALDANLTCIPILIPADLAEAKKWRTAIDETTNKTYYFNEETKETTWEYPLELHEANREKEKEINDTACVDDD